MTEPCPDCGSNKWKTIKKDKAWMCRKCGIIRKVEENGTDDKRLHQPNDAGSPSI